MARMDSYWLLLAFHFYFGAGWGNSESIAHNRISDFPGSTSIPERPAALPAKPPSVAAKQFINRLPVDNVLSKLLPASRADSNVKFEADSTRYGDFLQEAFQNTLLTKTKGGVSDKKKVLTSDKIGEMEELDKVEDQANLDLVEGINLMNAKNETLDQVLDEVLDQNCLGNATEAP